MQEVSNSWESRVNYIELLRYEIIMTAYDCVDGGHQALVLWYTTQCDWKNLPVQIHTELRSDHAQYVCCLVKIYSESPGVSHDCTTGQCAAARGLWTHNHSSVISYGQLESEPSTLNCLTSDRRRQAAGEGDLYPVCPVDWSTGSYPPTGHLSVCYLSVCCPPLTCCRFNKMTSLTSRGKNMRKWCNNIAVCGICSI